MKKHKSVYNNVLQLIGETPLVKLNNITSNFNGKFYAKLESFNPDNINLINVNEIGLSKSRNLAIENAKADICLLADDDIVYENNFESIILNAFNLNPCADIITFKMNDFKGF